MWWCCGKRGKDQPGCKFMKHESRDENEEVDMKDKEIERQQMLRYQRCLCCKELGHSIDNCMRDPNFKTIKDIKEESQRVDKIKNYRKLHADSLVSTT